MYRTGRIANFEGILGFSVPSIIFSEGEVNANHNVARSPSSAESDFRLLKNSEGNRDGEWNFCWRKEADVALFLQVTRIKKTNLTSRLLPETGRSESKETLVVYHLPQILGNSRWDVNGNKTFFWCVPLENSQLVRSEWKFVYHLQVS